VRRRLRRILFLLAPAGALACGGGGSDSTAGTTPGGGTQPAASAPAISLSPAAATFAATAGAASPAAQPIAIANGGTGTLGGLAAGTVAYGAGQATGWLSASLSAVTAPATLTLTPATAALTAGAYTATVPITSSTAGVTNTPQSVSVTLTVAAAPVASLTLAAAGQSSAFLTSPNFSATLAVQAGSQYLVAVVNTDVSYTLQEGFSLSGSFASTAAAQAGARGAAIAQGGQAPVPPAYAVNGPLPPSFATLRAAAQNHTAVLDQDRRIFASFGNPRAAWTLARAQGARPTAVRAAITQTIGAVSKVYVLHSLTGSCTAVDSIGARTVAVGQHVIVLADTNRSTWPQAYRPDTSFYQAFADEYDQVTWPHLLANIGNPLAYDASLSHAGKVTVTLTPVLNNFGGATGGGMVVAFVNGCDFYPFAASGSSADLSNQTEMFYSLVPAANGYSVASWEAELRATAAHESKHIVSFADRIINDSPTGEVIWLEEGLAQESSEIWERNFNQATWKGNATFLQTVACEIDLGAGAPCDHPATRPLALVGSHLPFFFEYLQAESSSNSEGLGLDTPANYGAGWTIARWATDQYATTDEGTFIKSLINEPSLTGLSNLAAHTGQTVPLLLVYWNLATAIFQTPSYTAADARTTIPSFNFANIDSIGQKGLTCNGTPCGLFTTSGSPNPTYPLQPIAVTATGTFSRAVTGVAGTSASYFLLSAPGGGIETLRLLTSAGAALASTSGLRVAIVRVR
jgi:hypothetical protein